VRPLAPAAAAAATGVQVGAAIVATRWVVADVGVVPLALLRYAIGAACLLPFALAARGRVRSRDLAGIAILGTAQFAVVVVLLNYALVVIPAARVALIFATAPLAALLMETTIDRRRLGLVRLGAVLMAVIGVAVALSEDPLGPGGRADAWVGDVAVLGSALCAALCSVLYRPYLARYPAVAVSAVAMFASVLALLPATAVVGWSVHTVVLATGAWTVIVAIGVSSGVGYYLWLWALTRERSTEVTMFLALSPLTAAVLGALLLGEVISARLSIGVVLVVVGLWLAQRSDRAAPQVAPAHPR